MSAESLLPWFWNGLEGPVSTADYRDIVLVAGRDPYAWKGTEERASAHVRPSGEGGCGSADKNMAADDEDDDHEHNMQMGR